MSEKGSPDRDYEVGYGKPPKHTQFKPGQSGNPRGRPRRTKNIERLIQAELDKVITVTEGGRTKHATKRELIVTQLINRAIKGDSKSLQHLLSHLEKHREIEPFVATDVDDAELLRALGQTGATSPPDTEGDDGER